KGLVEGQNVALDYRWAEGQYDRLAKLAAELVRQQVGVIVTMGGEPAALAAKAATTTIPIVFVGGSDPIRVGLVTNVHRPGGNIRCPLIPAAPAPRAATLPHRREVR